jgi:hypothetical protein
LNKHTGAASINLFRATTPKPYYTNIEHQPSFWNDVLIFNLHLFIQRLLFIQCLNDEQH